MSRRSAALFLTLSVIGCRGPQVTPVPSHPGSRSHIGETVQGSGGPRIVSYFEVGRIEEKQDVNAEGWKPGGVTLLGARVIEGRERDVGLSLTLEGAMPSSASGTPSTSTIFMDREDALAFKKAIEDEIDYVAQRQKKPPQHHEFMRWRSIEGLSITVGPQSSGDSFFTLYGPGSDSGNAFDSRVMLQLPQEAGQQLIVKIDAAMNLANGSD